MAKNYEMVYILSPALGDEDLQAARERIQGIVSANAEINDVQDWGRKRLAYEINDFKEGAYSLVTFSAEAEAPIEIERLMRIQADVLRYLIVRQEEA